MPASTKLLRADNGEAVTLGDLVLTQEQPEVWSLDANWRLVPRRVLRAFPSGIKPVYRLRLASGLEVEATGNHRFRTIEGWVRLDELSEGDFIAVPRQIPSPLRTDKWDDDSVRRVKPNPNVDLIPWGIAGQVKWAMKEAGVSGRSLASQLSEGYSGSYLLGDQRRPRRFSRGRLARIAAILGDDQLAALATSGVFWDEIVERTPLGLMPTFDATVEDTHNFVANGVIAHNSLEQDADVVMFLYRDEVYNPESPDRGTAEVILSKHRNGPTGVTQLAFLDHYTRFANMARV
jgi:replicative DNA helicase